MLELHMAMKFEKEQSKEFQNLVFNFIQKNEDKIEEIYYDTKEIQSED